MTISYTNMSTSGSISTDDTIKSNLPEGSSDPEAFGGLVYSGMSNDGSVRLGTGSRGYVWSQRGAVPSGELTLRYAGVDVKTKSIASERYSIIGLPSSIEQGESVSRGGDTETEAKTEAGGIGTVSIDAGVSGGNFDFAALTVQINDVDGNGVSRSSFTVAGGDYTTGSGGSESLDSSGTVTVTALRDSVSRDVTVSGSITETFTFAGVSGKVRGAGNVPVAGVTVKLLDSNDNELERTTTDANGQYSFKTVPVSTTVQVEAIGITRSFTSKGEGQDQTKNIPFDAANVSSIEVECFDAETGRPVRDVDVTIGSNSSKTDRNGFGVMSTTSTGDITLTAASADGRYEQFTVERNLSAGENVSVQIDLVPRTASTRA